MKALSLLLAALCSVEAFLTANYAVVCLSVGTNCKGFVVGNVEGKNGHGEVGYMRACSRKARCGGYILMVDNSGSEHLSPRTLSDDQDGQAGGLAGSQALEKRSTGRLGSQSLSISASSRTLSSSSNMPERDWLARMRELEFLLESSVIGERYEEASAARDAIKALRDSDKVTKLSALASSFPPLDFENKLLSIS